MRFLSVGLIVVCVLIAVPYPLTIFAETRNLLDVHSLRCRFSLVMQADWRGGKLKNSTDKKDEFVLHFDSIDTQRKQARLIGNLGAADVTVIPSVSGLHFLEETPSGSLNFTTVFQSFEKTSGDFIAVTSRHLFLPDEEGRYPFPSQRHGTCKVWE
jgi:hypothetical protein